MAQFYIIRQISKSMDKKNYNIVMKTPVGSRHGTISLCIINNKIYGTLNLLGHSEAFTGSVENDGTCSIHGNLVTLIRRIDYTAVGKISRDTIELSLREERNIFKITGVAVPESEVNE